MTASALSNRTVIIIEYKLHIQDPVCHCVVSRGAGEGRFIEGPSEGDWRGNEHPTEKLQYKSRSVGKPMKLQNNHHEQCDWCLGELRAKN